MKNKILTIALVLLSPIIYYELTMLSRIKVAFPMLNLFSIKSLALFAIIFTLTNAVCAIITGCVTALPCGYLLWLNQIYVKILLVVAILCFPTFAYFTQSKYDYLTSIDFIGQCISVFIAVYFITDIGHRAAQKKRNL